MKHVDEHYKDWCGKHHTVNSCHPVHDSAEACDFAEYYHKEKLDEGFIIDVIYMRKNQKAYNAKGTTRHYLEMEKYQKKVDNHIAKYLSQQTLPF